MRSINDSEDPLQRMLSVLRFAFSKELKFVVGSSVFSWRIPLTLGLEGQSLQTVQ